MLLHARFYGPDSAKRREETVTDMSAVRVSRLEKLVLLGKSSKLPEARFIPHFSFVHLTNAFLEHTMPASHQLPSEHLLIYETGGTSPWHLFSPKEPFLERGATVGAVSAAGPPGAPTLCQALG